MARVIPGVRGGCMIGTIPRREGAAYEALAAQIDRICSAEGECGGDQAMKERLRVAGLSNKWPRQRRSSKQRHGPSPTLRPNG